MDRYQTPRELREKAAVTLLEMAARLGIPDADIEALEATRLEFWEVGVLRDYAEKLGRSIRVVVEHPGASVCLF
jgi:hypothetical protein